MEKRKHCLDDIMDEMSQWQSLYVDRTVQSSRAYKLKSFSMLVINLKAPWHTGTKTLRIGCEYKTNFRLWQKPLKNVQCWFPHFPVNTFSQCFTVFHSSADLLHILQIGYCDQVMKSNHKPSIIPAQPLRDRLQVNRMLHVHASRSSNIIKKEHGLCA